MSGKSFDVKSFFLGVAAVSAIILSVEAKKRYNEKQKKKQQLAKQRKRTASFAEYTTMPVPILPHHHEQKMQARITSIREEVVSELSQERNKVCVRVPATSANFGPGFDTLGMALDMWAELTVERADTFEMVCEGDGADKVPLDETNLLYIGVKTAFDSAGKEVPPLKFYCKSSIPFARGLGSSSAAIVGGLVAGLVLAGHRLPCWGAEAVLNMAAEIEGHPDNVAPCLYGGIQVGIHAGGRWRTERVPMPPGLQCVIFIPDKIGITKETRAVLEERIHRKEAIFNIGRVAWLINALATSNIDNIQYGCDDMLHQPQRGAKCFSHMQPLIDAALKAGANGAYLSGAGPTILAITSGASGDIFTQREQERVDKAVGEAMARAAEAVGVKGQVYVTKMVETGATVVHSEPGFSDGLVRYTGGF